LPQVLASAGVILTILTAGAGRFSVPSKLWSAMCAGRPSIVAVPATNQAARVAQASGGCVLVSEGGEQAVVKAIRRMKESDAERDFMGVAARRYAEEHFAIGPIADRFETVFAKARQRVG